MKSETGLKVLFICHQNETVHRYIGVQVTRYTWADVLRIEAKAKDMVCVGGPKLMLQPSLMVNGAWTATFLFLMNTCFT